MATGYEDIERLTTQKQNMLDNSLKQQNDIINKQTQMSVDRLERQKQDIDKDVTRTNKAIYQDYRKASNPFGQQAENLASQGLGNSGYAETTQSRLYNTYQQGITSTLNSARELKNNVDFEIQQAIQSGDITKGQNALELYKQKLQLLSEEFDLRNNREQFLYQKSQDALAQSNWQKEYDYNKSIDKRNFEYQKSRDKVSDSHWEKEYALSKKARASSSRSSGRRSSKKTSSGSTSINLDDDTKLSKNAQVVLGNVQELLKGVAKGGLTIGSIVTNLKTGNIAGALKTVKNTASNSVYNAYKNGNITEEEAKAITKKLGL